MYTQRIRDILILRYINLHFTYLLTYLNTTPDGSQERTAKMG